MLNSACRREGKGEGGRGGRLVILLGPDLGVLILLECPGVSPGALLGKQWWGGPGGPRSLPGWGYGRLRLTPGYSSSIRALRPGPNRYQGRSVCVPGGCCARKPGPDPGVGTRARA